MLVHYVSLLHLEEQTVGMNREAGLTHHARFGSFNTTIVQHSKLACRCFLTEWLDSSEFHLMPANGNTSVNNLLKEQVPVPANQTSCTEGTWI